MRFIRFLSPFIFLMLLSGNISAQNGIIRGSVFDEYTGEALAGVTIVVEGSTKGMLTDLDGKFNISIEAGVYNLRFSFISY